MSSSSNSTPGVMLYYDLRPAIAYLSREEKGELLDAILSYGEDEAEPELDGAALRMLWTLVAPRIDADRRRYRAKCERARASSRKRWDANACDGIETDANSTTTTTPTTNSTTTPSSTSASTSASTPASAPASASRGEGGAEGGKFSTVSTEFSTATGKDAENGAIPVEKPVENVQNPAYTYDRESLLRQIVGSGYGKGNAFRPSHPSCPSSKRGLERVFGGMSAPYGEEDGYG